MSTIERIAVVTATLDVERALPFILSWLSHSAAPVDLYIVGQTHELGGRSDWKVAARQAGHAIRSYTTPQILGVVPAFNLGLAVALRDGANIIACLHDDLEIEQQGWDETIRQCFKNHPRAGLCGFGGATGLGDADIYQKPYNPMQLARQGFRSNMRYAEAHGIRSLVPEQVACLDGFSQIGRREFWRGIRWPGREDGVAPSVKANLLQEMADWGIIHHCYDGALGAWARRLGYETWYVPVRVHHYGGLTAVGDARYAEWARSQHPDGDAGFWAAAHRLVYDHFRDVLPLRS